MAIIPCRECAHQVSDQAPNCPSCGAPVTPTDKIEPRGRRYIVEILITLMALWTIGTVLYLLVPGSASKQLMARAKSSVSRFERGTGQLPATDQTKAAYQARAASGPATPAVTREPAPALRPVFRTSAQQLYQDFNANVVAIRSRIGTSRVRVTGTVAEIDQDVAGHPVVKLSTGKDATLAMTLRDDQRAAAAELTKDEAVEIECDKIGHSGDLIEGSDCTLALVDVMQKQANLALFVANDNGITGVYVVGPLSESACLAQGDGISSKLRVNQRGEYVVWRGCTNAARDSIAPEGCRLDSSAPTVPEMAPAHLWRYDCGSSGAAHTSLRKQTPATFRRTAAVAAAPNTGSATEPEAGTGNSSAQGNSSVQGKSQDLTAAGTVLVPSAAAALAATATQAAPAEAATSPIGTAARVGTATTAAAGGAEHAETSNIRLASVSNSDTGTATATVRTPTEEATVAHPPPQDHSEQTTSGASQSGAPATPDDLAQVRAVDPQAADHIASYCSKTIVSANRDALIGECRHSEAEAWTRFVQQNEFPTLDDATRRKCSEPPFPDTYVAKESCARYELHMN